MSLCRLSLAEVPTTVFGRTAIVVDGGIAKTSHGR
jgi:hypothetical protein